MTITMAMRFVLACCWLIFCGTPAMSDAALDLLVAAYPEQSASHDDQNLVWKDGTRQPLSDRQTQKTFDDLLNHPSIVDQFAIPYRLGPQTASPSVNQDPGRIRNEEFFKKMYGDCRKGEVVDQLRRGPPVAPLSGGNDPGTPVFSTSAKHCRETCPRL